MSKLKLSPNLFLEVAELENFRRLMVDEGYKAVFKSMVKNFGNRRDYDNNAFEITPLARRTLSRLRQAWRGLRTSTVSSAVKP